MNTYLVTTTYRKKTRSVIWIITEEDNKFEVKEGVIYTKEDNPYIPSISDWWVGWGAANYNEKLYLSECNGIRIVDNQFNTLKRYHNKDLLYDVHDLNIIQDKIYVANTGCDRVEIFDLDLNHLETIDLHNLSKLCNIKTKSKDKESALYDSFHINFIEEHKGDIYLTFSFIYEKYGNFKINMKFPFFQISPKQSPGAIYNLSKRTFFAKNLKGVHDGVWVKNSVWVTHTHNMSIDVFKEDGNLKNQKLFENLAVYRGLVVTDKYIITGATRVDYSRTAAQRVYKPLFEERKGKIYEKSKIIVLNRENFDEIYSIDLPDHDGVSPEIFKIIQIDN